MTDMYCHFFMILLLHYYLVYLVLFGCYRTLYMNARTRQAVRHTHIRNKRQHERTGEKKWNEFDIDWHISYWHWQVHCSVCICLCRVPFVTCAYICSLKWCLWMYLYFVFRCNTEMGRFLLIEILGCKVDKIYSKNLELYQSLVHPKIPCIHITNDTTLI